MPTLSLSRTAQAVAGGERSASAVLEACIARIEATDARVNAFTGKRFDAARAQAAQVDARRARGEPLGPLAGVPFAVKNLFDIAGEVTLAGSKVNRTHPPATADAVLVQRLQAAGAVLVGSLNMDEYAYGFTTENTHYGPCHNPHDLTRIAGRWFLGRLCRGGGGRPGAADAGLGHQRLHPCAVVAVRRVGPQAHVWAPVAPRQLPVCAQHRPSGPVRRRPGTAWLWPMTRCKGPTRWTRAATRRPRAHGAVAGARGDGGLRIGLLGGYFHDNADAGSARGRVAGCRCTGRPYHRGAWH